MRTRLVAVTQPIIKDAATAQEFVAYCARVSNPSNQANHSTATKLLNYMVRKQHWSPFEMAHAVIEIETTRDIARQILRHRSFSFQEFSQRYAEVAEPPVFREPRLQDLQNRQSSLETSDLDLADWWTNVQTTVAHETKQLYQAALSRGIAKEVARCLLPEGLTPSRLYMSGTIRSWIHYIQLRTGPETQKEHREIAQSCEALLLDVFPSLEEIFDERE